LYLIIPSKQIALIIPSERITLLGGIAASVVLLTTIYTTLLCLLRLVNDLLG
jgi:hypothetical protein